jgi:hypothetical protein
VSVHREILLTIDTALRVPGQAAHRGLKLDLIVNTPFAYGS